MWSAHHFISIPSKHALQTVLATIQKWIQSGPAGLVAFFHYLFSPLVIVLVVAALCVVVYVMHVRVALWRLRRREVLHALYREQEDKKYLLQLIRDAQLEKIRS